MELWHIPPGCEDSVEAVEDVLDRGSVDDWRELAARVRRDPDGEAARSLRVVLCARHFYGTTTIWRDFPDRVERAPPASYLVRRCRRSVGPAPLQAR